MAGLEPPAGIGDDPPQGAATVAPRVPANREASPPVEPAKPSLELPTDLEPLPSLSEFVEGSPPWLVSALVHMLIVIILGLIAIEPKLTEGLLLQFDTAESEVPVAGDIDLAIGVPDADLNASLVPRAQLDVTEVITETPSLEIELSNDSLSGEVEPIRMALSGRESGMQKALLGAYGGTGGTQSAVMEALRWLARNQGRNGMWSLQGPYKNGSNSENFEAATAMALIAFQGAGYVPGDDEDDTFEEVVTRGWKALLSKQDSNGNFFQSGQGTSQLYTQALCSIALCELYGMTHDRRYQKSAQLAIDYCVEIQAPEGGWKYFPGTGSDLSVTGWFVMALQSGRMAGLKIPSRTLLEVSKFLDSVSHEYGSHYAYQENSPPSKSMTAEGLLCRQYLGWRRDDDRLHRGASYLLDNLLSWDVGDRDAYYWYYATQVCHHMEGQHWQKWNAVMREVMPQNQEKEGRERGSWDPTGFRWNSEGGRLFITCLSTYMLEVYYRHLPIYQQDLIGGL